MKRIGPFSVEGALLITLSAMVLLGVTTCNARRDGRREAHLEVLRENEHKAVLAGIRSRRRADSVVRKVDSVTRTMTSRIAANRKVEVRLLERLAENDSLLSAYRLNLGDSSQAYTLSVALQRTNEQVRLFRDSTEVVLAGVADLVSAHEAERQAWLAEREQNAIQVAVQDSLISALRESKQCRILFLTCPNRVQSVAIGALGTLLLLLL